ncbi:MAG: hypothetical protein FJ304_21005 [Planctomycetes bacterium]|nr:hypothetical protein [Planctomycetota bacterium]
MPQDATCPSCSNVFPVTEARGPFTVPCPRCETDLTVEFQKLSVPHEAGQPHYDLSVKPGKLPDAAPTSAGSTKRKRDDDEDDDDADAKARAGGSGIVILSGLLGLFFVLGGLGLTTWLLFYEIDTESASNTNSNTNTNRSNNSGNNNKGNTGGNNKGNTGGGNKGTNPGGGGNPPAKDWFEFRPVTGALPQITAPTLTDAVSNLDLDGKVGQTAVGGGGRYIVMHFPQKGQLSLFDVNSARITATVPTDTGDIQLTAGLTKVVTYANGSIFRVYRLPDLAKLYDTSAPGGVRGIAMGSKTNGPFATVATFGDVALWDVGENGIKQVELSAGKPGVHWHDRCLRAAPDGTAFSTQDGLADRNKTILLTEQGGKWRISADTFAAPFPGHDGNFYGNGVVINKSYQDQRFGGIGAGSNTWFLPSISNRDYFLKLVPKLIGTGAKQKRTVEVSVHRGRDSNTPAGNTAVLTEQPEFDGFADRFRTEPAVVYDQHLFLVPEAKMLVTLNKARDRLVIRKLDLN